MVLFLVKSASPSGRTLGGRVFRLLHVHDHRLSTVLTSGRPLVIENQDVIAHELHRTLDV